MQNGRMQIWKKTEHLVFADDGTICDTNPCRRGDSCGTITTARMGKGRITVALNEKTERVIDFSREREWRQRRFERVFEQFNDRLVNFMLHRINVREKVRAKHIFNHFTDTSVEDLQEPFWESHYEYWLLYEYLNIQGKKVVERFFEQYRSELDDAWIKTGRPPARRLSVAVPDQRAKRFDPAASGPAAVGRCSQREDKEFRMARGAARRPLCPHCSHRVCGLRNPSRRLHFQGENRGRL